MSILCIVGLPFIFMVFIALTYDKTVTPAVNGIKKKVGSLSQRFSNHQETEAPITAKFRLYDETLIIVPIALAWLTYSFFSSGTLFYYKGTALVFFLWIVISFLFKAHSIIIFSDNTIRFQGVVRNIDMDISEITGVQDWMIFVRVKCRNRSLMLFPYIDKLGEFKTTIKKLNAEAQIEDMSNEFYSPKFSAAFLIAFIIFWLN